MKLVFVANRFGLRMTVPAFFVPHQQIKNIYTIAYPIFTVVVIYIFLRVFYNFAPDRVRDKTNISTGALVTSIGWYIITFIYSYTSHNMTTYNLLYSSLSNLALLMVWLYFISYMSPINDFNDLYSPHFI